MFIIPLSTPYRRAIFEQTPCGDGSHFAQSGSSDTAIAIQWVPECMNCAYLEKSVIIADSRDRFALVHGTELVAPGFVFQYSRSQINMLLDCGMTSMKKFTVEDPPAKNTKSLAPPPLKAGDNASSESIKTFHTVDEIADYSLRLKVRQILHICPRETVQRCLDALKLKEGNVVGALNWLHKNMWENATVGGYDAVESASGALVTEVGAVGPKLPSVSLQSGDNTQPQSLDGFDHSAPLAFRPAAISTTNKVGKPQLYPSTSQEDFLMKPKSASKPNNEAPAKDKTVQFKETPSTSRADFLNTPNPFACNANNAAPKDTKSAQTKEAPSTSRADFLMKPKSASKTKTEAPAKIKTVQFKDTPSTSREDFFNTLHSFHKANDDFLTEDKSAQTKETPSTSREDFLNAPLFVKRVGKTAPAEGKQEQWMETAAHDLDRALQRLKSTPEANSAAPTNSKPVTAKETASTSLEELLNASKGTFGANIIESAKSKPEQSKETASPDLAGLFYRLNRASKADNAAPTNKKPVESKETPNTSGEDFLSAPESAYWASTTGTGKSELAQLKDRSKELSDITRTFYLEQLNSAKEELTADGSPAAARALVKIQATEAEMEGKEKQYEEGKAQLLGFKKRLHDLEAQENGLSGPAFSKLFDEIMASDVANVESSKENETEQTPTTVKDKEGKVEDEDAEWELLDGPGSEVEKEYVCVSKSRGTVVVKKL